MIAMLYYVYIYAIATIICLTIRTLCDKIYILYVCTLYILYEL